MVDKKLGVKSKVVGERIKIGDKSGNFKEMVLIEIKN